MREPTPEITRDFWYYMLTHFEAKSVLKDSSGMMQVAGSFLDLIDVQDKEQFMHQFVTTIGKTIYVPFTVGDPALWSLWSQIQVCVHECQHVVQGEREGWTVFDSRYVTSASFRAGYEAEAYGCDMEMTYWRTGQILDIDRRVASLKNYACKAEQIEQAKQMLTLRAGIVAQGAVSNEASIAAIGWLNAHAPELSA